MSDRSSQDFSNRQDQQGFPHFMLKEIYEQPQVVKSSLTRVMNLKWLDLEEKGHPGVDRSHLPLQLNLLPELGSNLDQIRMIACGTSFHASCIGKSLFEQLAGIPTIVYSASDYADLPPPLREKTLTIVVTQSGETADILHVLEQEHKRHARGLAHSLFLGITNRPGSSLEKQVNSILYTQAGTEIAIAATKTFTAQLLTFYYLSINLAVSRQLLPPEKWVKLLTDLQQIPEQIQEILETQTAAIAQLAQEFATTQSCILLGRGLQYPIALEGALKLKETSYLHAEGYHAGEFMHGPVAMLDEQIPVVAIADPGQTQTTLVTNLQKVKARGSPLIGIVPENSLALQAGLWDHILFIPDTDKFLAPLLTIVPLQLLAYYIAVERGREVDRPRGLSKFLGK